MEKEALEEISKKLDILIKLQAIAAMGQRPLVEQIRLLDSSGLRPMEIAGILGKSANHIRVELVRIRKKGSD